MEKVKGLINKIKENPRKSILAVGLAALVATTAIKDNVHFGSVTLYNPQESHYTWGLAPTTTVIGDAKGNFYTLGLIVGINGFETGSRLNGDASGYGIIAGGNKFGDNLTLNGDASAYGVFAGVNIFGDNLTLNGDASAYGIVMGINGFETGSRLNGDASGYGIIASSNTFGDNSTLNGDASAYGIFSNNSFEDNSKITGNLTNKGIVTKNSVSGFALGSNDVFGLKDYVVSHEQKVEEGGQE